MALATGTRLGPYEIITALGAGGMGEVYKARDTRLDRHVALKVLPAHLAGNADLRARFEREARAISALNHPNICTLHDVGSDGSISYLVMELIDGETLANILRRGPLPIERALKISGEIAAALDRAHRQGIVHRDLKPANVMLTKSGVKLLDFGVARLMTPAVASHDAPTAVGDPITAEGTIVGTLQYMSPEQLEGKTTDARGDIFAFGCIVYEMVTGRRAFDGNSHASIITSVMSNEPPAMRELVAIAPGSLERLVRKCLTKSADDRWQNAGDLVTELNWIGETNSLADPGARSRSVVLPWLVAALAIGGAIIAARLAHPLRTPSTVVRSTLPSNGLGGVSLKLALALSPDSQHLVYVGAKDGKRVLWHRNLATGVEETIPGTDNAVAPFWSPDSEQVGFHLRGPGKLMRISLHGGDATPICDVTPGAGVAATWGRDGTIVFGEVGARAGLYRVPVTGGEEHRLTIPPSPKPFVLFPTFVGDSNRIVYETIDKGSDLHLHLFSTATNSDRDLGPIDSRAIIVGDALLYLKEGALFGVRVSRDLERIGEPALIATGIDVQNTVGAATLTASGDAIVFAGSGTDSRLTWFDRNGEMGKTIGPSGVTPGFRISPDQRTIVAEVEDPRFGTSDIWTIDVARGTVAGIATTKYNETLPVWSPDSQRIAFSFDYGGPPRVFSMPATGGEPVLLHPSESRQEFPTDWSPDGKSVWITSYDLKTKRDICLLPAGGGEPVTWLKTTSDESSPRISPNGRFVAYVSDAPGTFEVFVARFDKPSERVQIATGAANAFWSADGKELFYIGSDQALYSVAIRETPSLDAGPPRQLFKNREPQVRWMNAAVTADGRFLIGRLFSSTYSRPLNLIVNWQQLLPR